MFSYASEICIRKAQSFQRSDFDAEILNYAPHGRRLRSDTLGAEILKPDQWELNCHLGVAWLKSDMGLAPKTSNLGVLYDKEHQMAAIGGIFSFFAAGEAQTLALSTATTAFDGTYALVSSTLGPPVKHSKFGRNIVGN
jgi:hypothetical protein